MNAITVENLTKKYREHLAVDHISFEVKEGEFFAFLGENGAGKSTTINMLCTILKKSDGTVKIFDHELGKDDDEIRSCIGIVFQNSVLDDKLTVKENLYTRGTYYGLKKREIDQRLAPFMERLELKDIWNRKYEKLSGGQRRRVDIIRALIHDPKILFLDEPTTGLDPMSRKLVWDYIDYLRSGAFFGMLSAAAGFVIGAYIPVSQFSGEVQTLCSLFPASQVTIILRNKLLRGVLDHMDASIGGIDQGQFVQTIKELFTFKAHFFEADLNIAQMFLYVTAGILICIVLQIIAYSKTYRKK